MKTDLSQSRGRATADPQSLRNTYIKEGAAMTEYAWDALKHCTCAANQLSGLPHFECAWDQRLKIQTVCGRGIGAWGDCYSSMNTYKIFGNYKPGQN